MDNTNMDRYLGQTLDNRYELLSVIGYGGMAVVFKARCNLLNRFVAVKILREDLAADSEFRRRFKEEAQAVAMLSHPNIVSIYDVSRTPEVDYIVMELIEGITLKQYMKSKGSLSCKESIHFTTQIAKALSHAHAKGIVHRDIKPQNIMIGMDGAVKVADFGIAHLESEQAQDAGTAVGSVHYISPEQAKGLPADSRSDIYSLGVVLYEMLTGVLPYTGATAEAVALQHVSAAPTPLRQVNPEIPEELERITLKAMNADIEQRYQSADELLRDLDEYRLSSTGSVPVAPAREPEDDRLDDNLPPNVPPLSRTAELSKESYMRRHRRSAKVSLLSGIFLVIIFIIAVFVFLWNYWLRDVFSEAVRISVPNFVGSDYEEIINSKDFKSIYNFKVTYAVDADSEEGTIIAQNPEEGKSLTKDEDGIDIQLTVSTGIQMIQMIDVLNSEYKEAVEALQKSGFLVDVEFETSDTITENYVISTSPEAGDSIPAGATVYMKVSSGPSVVTLQMPNLKGLSRSAAIAKIESSNLALGTITYVDSEMPEGTVVWQSKTAYTEVNEHDKIYLQVSSGPKETEPPAETPVAETQAPSETTNPSADIPAETTPVGG